MKKYAALFLLAFLFAGCMPAMIPTGSATVQKVIEIPGVSKDVIYERSRIWIAKTFHSSKAVIEYENKETGVIIGNGVANYAVKNTGSLLYPNLMVDIPFRFTMEENIRDEKIRITFTSLSEGTLESPVIYQVSMDRIRPVLLSLADDLGAALRSPQTNEAW